MDDLVLPPPEKPATPKAWRKAYLKSEPLLVGAAWSLIVQGTVFAAIVAGYNLDATLWRGIALGVGALAFILGRSHIFTLAIRMIFIRCLHFTGLLSQAHYQRLAGVVMKAFTDRIIKD